MSGYPNQPNHHQMQSQQHPHMMYPTQQSDQMGMSSQQGNQPNQMNYGIGGMGQPNDSYMHQHNQQYSMNPAPSGMNPQIYSSLSASNFQARSPYNIAAQGMSSVGGPHSIPQPGSANPLSVPQQGPGSVPTHGPLSVPQHGPGSVQGAHSISHQGPGSVPGQGPLSVSHHGPGSIPIHAPLSVPQPTSVLGSGPGSVPQSLDAPSLGGPLSVPGATSTGANLANQGPSPSSLGLMPQGAHGTAIGQGRSPLPLGPSPSSGLHQGASPSVNNPLSHGGPQSISGHNPSTPHDSPATRQPAQAATADESVPYDGIFLADPMQLSKQLISKDLRQSFSEMNRSMGELLRNRDNLTAEQNEKYTRDYNEFMAVCDQVEQSLTIVLETSKMMTKLDRSYTPDGGNQAGRSNEYTTQPLINYVDETNNMTSNVEKTVAGVFDMMSKIRKREALYKEKNGPKDEVKMETD